MRPIRSLADIEAAIAMLDQHAPAFRPVIAAAGEIPLRSSPSSYQGLAGIIVAQMVSRASADAIWARLDALLGEVTPDAILSQSPEILRGVGLSGAKEMTLRRLAQACADGLDLAAIAEWEAERALACLTSIKGIGPWSAEVYLLFCAGHADVFPVGDVALQAAAAHAFGWEKRPGPAEFRAFALGLSPCRSIAARVLWAYYARHVRPGGLPVAAVPQG